MEMTNSFPSRARETWKEMFRRRSFVQLPLQDDEDSPHARARLKLNVNRTVFLFFSDRFASDKEDISSTMFAIRFKDLLRSEA